MCLFSPGEKIWFKCDNGFNLIGAKDFTCQRNGNWQPQPFSRCVGRGEFDLFLFFYNLEIFISCSDSFSTATSHNFCIICCHCLKAVACTVQRHQSTSMSLDEFLEKDIRHIEKFFKIQLLSIFKRNFSWLLFLFHANQHNFLRLAAC